MQETIFYLKAWILIVYLWILLVQFYPSLSLFSYSKVLSNVVTYLGKQVTFSFQGNTSLHSEKEYDSQQSLPCELGTKNANRLVIVWVCLQEGTQVQV